MARLERFVDIVFCVDVSGSMAEHLEHVKKKILQMPKDLIVAFARREKFTRKLRVRLVLFADLREAPESLLATEFFVVHQEPEKDTPMPITQLAEFEAFVDGVSTSGGDGDEPESALEALSVAIGSQWTHEGVFLPRHVIVLFTDASAHNLESRVGEIPAAFRAQVPASLDELTDRWERKLATRLVGDARRLVVFAPDTYPWSIICDEDGWNNALWLPGQVGENLEDAEYEVITTFIFNHF